ncbi:hypothetical protein RSAG8_07868, partial [Rhizoctonia solani AG-8 WAC10335]
GTGRRPGAKSWLIAEYFRLFRLVASHCPSVGNAWIPLAEEHSSQQDTERSAKACQEKWNYALKFPKPTGKSKIHPLCHLARGIDEHINKVNATRTLNDNHTMLVEELHDSIEAEFETAERDLEGLEDTAPVFDTAPEEMEEVAGGLEEECEVAEEEADDPGDEEETTDDEVQDNDLEQFAPGEVPDDAEILEIVYQPPTPEPVPELDDSRPWDIEEDSQSATETVAQAPPARLRPKMVSPAKGQPTLFEHSVPAVSKTGAGAGPPAPSKASRPVAPAPFPWSSKAGSSTTPVAKAKLKSKGKAVTPAAKHTPDIKKTGNSTSKKRKPDESSTEEVYEYVVPKHTPGGKSAASSSKNASTSKKANGAPAKKTRKLDDDVINLTSSDDDHFINRLVERKEAGNLATVAIMDRNRELQLAREQLVDLRRENDELRSQIRDDQIEKEVQKRLKDLGAVTNPTGSSTANTTNPTPPADITNNQIHVALQKYLQDNNLKLAPGDTTNIGALWDAVPSGPAFDTTNPTPPADITNNQIHVALQKYLQDNNLKLAPGDTTNIGALWDAVPSGPAFDPTHPFAQSHSISHNFDAPPGGNFEFPSVPSNSNAGPSHLE